MKIRSVGAQSLTCGQIETNRWTDKTEIIAAFWKLANARTRESSLGINFPLTASHFYIHTEKNTDVTSAEFHTICVVVHKKTGNA